MVTALLLAAAIQTLGVSDATLAAPAPGETAAALHAVLENPSMYDIYIVSASADAAAHVELREPDGAGGWRTVPALVVPAYGSLELSAAGPHLRLAGLTRRLRRGDTVVVTLAADGGERVQVRAVVR